MRPFAVLAVSLAMLAAPALLRAEPRRHTVVIDDLKYKPAEIDVRAGDTVVWVNNDDRDHAVTADDGSFRSGRMGSGKRYEHTFAKSGKYAYGDDFFGRMRGSVTVRDAK